MLMAGHDHGAAGEERIALADAAPENAAVPDRRPFVRIKLFAHGGVNSVGGDQHVAVMDARVLARRLVEEARADARSGLLEVRQVMARQDAVASEPFDHRVEQDLLQGAAMDRELRPLVAGIEPARLRPDRLAVFREVGKLLGAHAGGVELVHQAELDQFAAGVRQHVDADAERLQFAHAFEDAARHADLMQAERQRQPADAAAGNENRHDKPHSMAGSCMRRRPGATAKT